MRTHSWKEMLKEFPDFQEFLHRVEGFHEVGQIELVVKSDLDDKLSFVPARTVHKDDSTLKDHRIDHQEVFFVYECRLPRWKKFLLTVLQRLGERSLTLHWAQQERGSWFKPSLIRRFIEVIEYEPEKVVSEGLPLCHLMKIFYNNFTPRGCMSFIKYVVVITTTVEDYVRDQKPVWHYKIEVHKSSNPELTRARAMEKEADYQRKLVA